MALCHGARGGDCCGIGDGASLSNCRFDWNWNTLWDVVCRGNRVGDCASLRNSDVNRRGDVVGLGAGFCDGIVIRNSTGNINGCRNPIGDCAGFRDGAVVCRGFPDIDCSGNVVGYCAVFGDWGGTDWG